MPGSFPVHCSGSGGWCWRSFLDRFRSVWHRVRSDAPNGVPGYFRSFTENTTIEYENPPRWAAYSLGYRGSQLTISAAGGGRGPSGRGIELEGVAQKVRMTGLQHSRLRTNAQIRPKHMIRRCSLPESLRTLQFLPDPPKIDVFSWESTFGSNTANNGCEPIARISALCTNCCKAQKSRGLIRPTAIIVGDWQPLECCFHVPHSRQIVGRGFEPDKRKGRGPGLRKAFCQTWPQSLSLFEATPRKNKSSEGQNQESKGNGVAD